MTGWRTIHKRVSVADGRLLVSIGLGVGWKVGLLAGYIIWGMK